VIKPPSQPQLPEAYARWQERLARLFFYGRAGQPVVMFVDRGELQQLAEPGEDGARALASAVRRLVDPAKGTRMFDPVERLQMIWRKGPRDAPPPTLPVLALSVLAASEMRSDTSGASHNYYIRLADALIPDGSASERESLRYMLGIRGAFLPVSRMWVAIDRWLKEQAGAFGLSTIRETHWTRIGYAQSQTLVRRSDRAALTRFFDRMHILSDGVPSADSLLRSLHRWTRLRPQGLSEMFVHSLTDPAAKDYVSVVVYELAAAWDGKIITTDGRRRLDIRLILDLEDEAIRWAIPAVAGLDGDVLRGTSAGIPFEAHLTRDPYSSLYEVSGLPPVTVSALTSGVDARGAQSMAEFQPAAVLVLAGNSDANGWLSVDAMEAYEEHVLVVSADMIDAVKQVLDTAADAGARQVPSVLTARMVGSGFAIFIKVRFSETKRLEAAVAALPVMVASRLRLGAAVRPRLINGLPIMRELGRNIYLAGGEPDLVLPGGDEPHHVTVTLDGRAQQLLASLFPFPLRRVPGIDLELGSHHVDVDGDELSFEVLDGSVDDRIPTGTCCLGWAEGELQWEPGADALCGVVTPGAAEVATVLARRNATESWLLHRDGRCTELPVPEVPSFEVRLNFPCFEVCKGAGAWLAQKRADLWHVTRLIGGFPAFYGLTATERLLWAELVECVATTDEVWAEYVSAWRRYRAR
jgi:hypothetical protein